MTVDFRLKNAYGPDSRLIDGDTEILADGKKERLLGFNTNEVARIQYDKYGQPTFEAPMKGSYEQEHGIQQLIEDGGFIYKDNTGEYDKYDRELVERYNAQGQKLSDVVVGLGMATPNRYTSDSALQNLFDRKLREELTGDPGQYNDIAQPVRDALDYGIAFKTLANDERDYDPRYHTGVMSRDHGRTLESSGFEQTGNMSRNQVSDAWGQGWMGVKEGIYGYLDAVGSVTGSEMIESIGEQGVLRAREQMRTAPEVVLDYREVDGIAKGFNYILNNAAMSAPYMVTTFASMAAAVPATMIGTAVGGPGVGIALGGATLYIPNSMIYGGHAWNEMEGEKGLSQFIVASTAGVGMAILDRFGLKGLMPASKVMTNEGVDKMAHELVRRSRLKNQGGIGFDTRMGKSVKLSSNRLTHGMAKQQIMKATRTENAKFLKGLMQLEKLDASELLQRYGKRFSVGEVGRTAGRGMLREAGTEAAQESLQYGAAVGFSDKKYDSEEFGHRLINATIAGGVLGGGLSSAGSIYTQGKEQLQLKGFMKSDLQRYQTVTQAKIDKIKEDGRIATIEENIGNVREESNEWRKGQALTPDTILEDLTEEAERLALSQVSDAELTRASVDDYILWNATQSQYEIETDPKEKRELEEQLSVMIDPELAERELARRAEGKRPYTAEERVNVQARIDKNNKARAAAKAAGVEGSKQPLRRTLSEYADDYIENFRGMVNFVKNNHDLSDYASAIGRGIGRLYRSAEKSAGDIVKILRDPDAIDILSRVGMLTQGVYHAGMAFRQYYDQLLASLKGFINETQIAQSLGYKTIDSKNVEIISDEIREFANNEDGPSAFEIYEEYQQTLEAMQAEAKAQGSQMIPSLDWASFYNEKKGNPKGTPVPYMLTRAKGLYEAALQVKAAWDHLMLVYNNHRYENDATSPIEVLPENHWWRSRGFDWKKVKNNKAEFIKWAKSAGLSDTQADDLYQFIAYKDKANFTEGKSLIDGGGWIPNFLNPQYQALIDHKGFDKFASKNMFENLSKAQGEVAKYASTTKYFGEGGSQLHYLISRMMQNATKRERSGDKDDIEKHLTPEEVKQFAYYIKSMIDSEHGNFNTVKSPAWAAINRFLVSWAIFSGLPLSALSSIPETAMIYYGLQDDEQWKKANEQLIAQFSKMWSDAAKAHKEKTEAMMKRSGLRYDNNTIIERYATGERDLAFVKFHEAFFKIIGIKDFTQIQRRMAAGLAVDFVKDYIGILELAPRIQYERSPKYDPKTEPLRFDFDNFNAFELEAYAQLSDLGLEVELLLEHILNAEELYRDIIWEYDPEANDRTYDSYFVEPSDKQKAVLSAIRKTRLENYLGNKQYSNIQERMDAYGKAIIEEANEIENFINEQLETAVYRFVNDRIMSPQSTNRPLFFQDPRYILLTQFNGFISTFTATVLPKLWNQYLRKGNPQVKYNTFAVIVLMLAMGGASQYLKDLLKFGQPSPYMDAAKYTQRALYSSGVLGQFERVVDVLYPLYPNRDDRFMSTLLGETGPAARNIQNVARGIGQAIEGDTERAANTVLKAAPAIGPWTGGRRAAADIMHGKNPLEDVTVRLW